MLISRTLEVFKRLAGAEDKLTALLAEDSKYTIEFFSDQWTRQREAQQNTISANTKKLRERMNLLMDLEEKLLESRYVPNPLHSKSLIFVVQRPLTPIYCLCIYQTKAKHCRRCKPSRQA